jgi:hypothetical protein
MLLCCCEDGTVSDRGQLAMYLSAYMDLSTVFATVLHVCDAKSPQKDKCTEFLHPCFITMPQRTATLTCSQVCQGAPTADGARVDMYSLLQPLRDLRPSHGGPGYSEEVLTELRALNFDLD